MDPRQPPAPIQPAAMKSRGPDKDEFGRDIRPGSADPEPAPTSAVQTISPFPTITTPTTQGPSVARGPTPNQQNPSPQLTTTPATMNAAQPEVAMPIATYESRSRDAGATKGLESFDFTTFNFTSPASWEALGKAWEATNGVTPTQEVLMQFVMMSGMGMGMGMGVGGGFGMEQPQNEWDGAQGSEGWNAGGAGWSDGGVEVVGETQGQEKPDVEVVGPEEEDSPVFGERSVGSSGKMQKVGDRWVFVRS